jgi:hypothetical protein
MTISNHMHHAPCFHGAPPTRAPATFLLLSHPPSQPAPATQPSLLHLDCYPKMAFECAYCLKMYNTKRTRNAKGERKTLFWNIIFYGRVCKDSPKRYCCAEMEFNLTILALLGSVITHLPSASDPSTGSTAQYALPVQSYTSDARIPLFIPS